MITIENMTGKEIPELCEFLGELFRIERDFQPSLETQARGLELLFASPHGIIKTAYHQGTLVGMATGQLVYSTSEGAPSVWMEDVFVLKDYRDRGIGRLLVASIIAWGRSKGATRFQLLADKDNQQALEFYKKLGWRHTNLITFRYKP